MSQPPPPPFDSPPPPPGGYGQQPPMPPGDNSPWDLGATVSYAWTKFQANMAQMIIATLAIFIGAVVILGLGFFLMFGVLAGDTECSYDEFGYYTCDSGGLGFFLTMLLFAITFGIFFIYAQVVGAGIIRGMLAVTEGRPFQTSEVFKFTNLGPVVVTSLIIGAGVIIGTFLCYLPGIVIGFVTSYALYFVIDKNLAPMDAIKASFELVKNNLGTTIIWYIVGGIIAQVGFLICGVGALVSIPVMLLGTAYTYKKLTGQPVAA